MYVRLDGVRKHARAMSNVNVPSKYVHTWAVTQITISSDNLLAA